MGRSATFYCKTCRVAHYLGYGSATTWMDDCKSLAEFDARPEFHDRAKNQAMRRALERHEGHDFMTQSGDWTHTHPGKLCGEFGPYGGCVTLIDDFDQWTREDFAQL